MLANWRTLRNFSKMLNDSQLKALSTNLPTWTHDKVRPSLRKRFAFKDFKEAWEFMGIVAKVAEEHNHHPEWLNIYNVVDVVLTTHDAKGLTTRDVWLATFMDKAESMVKVEHEDS